MNFNEHLRFKGEHAFLGASKYSWLNYDENKLIDAYLNHLAVQRGTELHDLAAEHIRLGIKMPKTKKTFDSYVNDAIGFKMNYEQPLVYSENCFGTADSISFRNGKVRIHDLKTGKTPASMKQLLIYLALFCLEYDIKPSEIEAELRIYQNDDIQQFIPSVNDVVPIMDKIKTSDRIISELKEKQNE
jgi:hypothetical protein